MISLTVAQMEGLLAQFGWPFVRILAFLATEAVLGNRAVPFSIKVALAVVVTVVVAPVLPAPPPLAVVSPEGLLILAQQVLVGVAMGFTTRIVITAAEMAGQMAGLQMGLGFAVFFDPQGAGQSPVVAQFMGVLAVLVLLASNSHYLMLTALVESFRIVPLSPAPLAAKGFLTLVSWASQIFQLGLMLSLPVVGALLVTNIGIGILTRAAPQLNVFAVGFPITLGVGFLMLYLSLPLLVPVIEQFSQAGFAVIQRILEGFRS
ncbi:MAG: flagellar biosynthetic protein FliR [Betaproteobacteria bacterium]|nr:flagellar biosynthetic protein FliR [Betaproteobacteria bacterium]